VIRWTERAGTDLVGIAEWIATHDQAASQRVVNAILSGVARLEAHPRLGRNGRVPNTRELVIRRFPYVVIYRPLTDAVVILRVLHGAMRWPPLTEI
jgi:toxin ParE1/3/4